MTTLTVDIPRDYWMTANRPIASHGHRKRIIDALHERTVTSALRQGMPAIEGPHVARWTIHYPLGVGEADPDNAFPTCKALMDALVPRWVVGDSSKHITERRYRRGPNLPDRRHYVVVLELIPDRPGEVR